ncbi:MAG: fumarylacetoacetate hydrolase family protein [Chlorobiaceae bacterium]|nr:fumarylacetoacetate hydrolase family protein [Chlorobiaceae bacterium]NTW74870.1 fumarylacetoacetate hydrolase family protein [Chlorobiaceae bacterium]
MKNQGDIFCIGKNYADHAREMAHWTPELPQHAKQGSGDEPIIFMKPCTALSPDGRTSIPVFEGRALSSCMHHEVELVLLIGCDADSVGIEDAPSCISGYGVGLDMTLRDVQLDAKKTGNPWLKSKGFRNSALVSEFISPACSGNWDELSISLRLNDRLVQHSPVSKMTFSPAYLVHYLSYIYGLRKGDLIFTGTPAGVGRVISGDRLDAVLESGTGRDRVPTILASLEATVI